MIIIESFSLGYWHRRSGGEPFRDREDAKRFIERLRAYDRLGDYRIIEKDEDKNLRGQQ
jgi:hypothetical protein